MKTKWTVYLKDGTGYVKLFVFYDYDSVQNLIGYMMEGTTFLSIDINKEVIDEQ